MTRVRRHHKAKKPKLGYKKDGLAKKKLPYLDDSRRRCPSCDDRTMDLDYHHKCFVCCICGYRELF